MRVVKSLNRGNDVISSSLFHSTSLLFFALLCCSVRERRCCTLQRSSTSLLLLDDRNIPPSFEDLGVHTKSFATYSHCQAMYSVSLTSGSASPPCASALHPVTWRRSVVFSVDGKGFWFQRVFPQYGVLAVVLFYFSPGANKEEKRRGFFLAFHSTSLLSLLLFATAWVRDAAPRYDEVPQVYTSQP